MQQQQLLGLTIIPASLLGIVCNGLIVTATWKMRSLNHSFSLLTGYQALFNGLHSIMFMFFAMPLIVLNIEILRTNSHYIGFVLLLSYDVTAYSHFLTAINRFCAVFFPFSYRSLFSLKSTIVLILFTLIFSLSVHLVFYFIYPCKCTYDPIKWTFGPNNDIPVCLTYSLNDAGKVVFLTVFDVVIDMITISKVRRTRKLIRNGQPAVASVKKKEVDFLMQSFSQSMYVFLAMPIFMIVPMLTTNKVIGFVIGDLLWVLLHALDGVFTLSFNSEVRRTLQKMRESNKTVTVSSSVHDGKSKLSVVEAKPV